MADGTQNQTEAKGPLNGVRIIDLTQFVLGPYATQTLGDLGADVIKVEEPGGDRQRKDGKPPNLKEMGPSFIALNRNKRSVALDLKSEDGKAALRALVLTGDIFIHNMRPSAIARLGFSYEDVRAIKPNIVYVEAMGYAQEGPYAGLQAFDDLIQSASGACSLNQLVNPEAELRPLPSIIADKTCGLFATIATLAALQSKLLDVAARAIAPGGRLVYCVCSLETEEGEGQVRAFLKRRPDFALEPMSPGEGGAPEASLAERGWLRILPHQMEGGIDGFFIARMKRAD
jgi:hypothetical protein